MWLRSLGQLEPCRRDPAPGRRLVLRPARAAPRFPARGARTASRRAGGGTCLGGQHARQRRAREPGACCPSFPSWPSTCSASTCACRPCPPGGAATSDGRQPRAGPPRPARDQADRPAVRPDGRRSAGSSAAAHGTTCGAGSRPDPHAWVGQAAADAGVGPDARPRPVSRPAAPCCGPSRWPAATPTSAMPGGLTRVARRHWRRGARALDLQPGRRHQQGHLGAGLRAGEAHRLLVARPARR